MAQNTLLPDDFDRETYLALNPDVRAAGIEPAIHYITYGFNEGRLYKPKTDDLEGLLAQFLTVEPTEQNAFDLFPKSWSTYFEGFQTFGTAGLTNDGRIRWLLDKLDLRGKHVLELGPLEAGHTLMLEKAGAKVLAIEANKGAFLRCLIVKNQLGLDAKFLLGDFEKFDFSSTAYDLILASGVLYHLKDPVAFLSKASKFTEKIFLWTHYFEPDLELWNKALQHQISAGKWDIGNPVVVELPNLTIRTIRQNYNESLNWSGFCGGTDSYSNWIYKDDLLALLKALGFKQIEITLDEVDNRNGPAFCVLAQK